MNIDWSKAPDWAIANALYAFGGEISRMWVGESQYQPFDSLRPYPYGGGVGEVRHNCTRREFCYETPRPTPWTGEGLPPVGSTCEVDVAGAWTSGVILAHCLPPKEGFAVAQIDGEVGIAIGAEHDFRTIRTPEQIATEERELAITDICLVLDKDPSRPTLREKAGILYDAGYRKQVKP